MRHHPGGLVGFRDAGGKLSHLDQSVRVTSENLDSVSVFVFSSICRVDTHDIYTIRMRFLPYSQVCILRRINWLKSGSVELDSDVVSIGFKWDGFFMDEPEVGGNPAQWKECTAGHNKSFVRG